MARRDKRPRAWPWRARACSCRRFEKLGTASTAATRCCSSRRSSSSRNRYRSRGDRAPPAPVTRAPRGPRAPVIGRRLDRHGVAPARHRQKRELHRLGGAARDDEVVLGEQAPHRHRPLCDQPAQGAKPRRIRVVETGRTGPPRGRAHGARQLGGRQKLGRRARRHEVHHPGVGGGVIISATSAAMPSIDEVEVRRGGAEGRGTGKSACATA